MRGDIQPEVKGHTDSMVALSFVQDGSRLVSRSNENKVQIWNTMTGDIEG